MGTEHAEQVGGAGTQGAAAEGEVGEGTAEAAAEAGAEVTAKTETKVES